METSIEKILTELVGKVAKHFNLDLPDALAAGAHSRVAKELSLSGNVRNLSLDQLCVEIYDEIANGE